MQQGYYPIRDWEVMQDIYNQYHALGGNSVISHLKDELDGRIADLSNGRQLTKGYISAIWDMYPVFVYCLSVLSMIIENLGFLPNYSGYANLRLLSRIQQIAGKQEIIHAMENVGLDWRSKKWVSKYSIGMRQHLCIAQAIMEDPSILNT